jgi:hypothetical protein
VFKPNLLFSIDVSGTPFTRTIVSCVSFNLKNSPQVLDKFNKEFRNYKNKKGKDLKHDKLMEIIKFLDDNKIRSSCACFTANDWKYALKETPENKAYRKEKIFGIIYYMILEVNAKPRYSYSVNVCEENFMDIDRVISSCRKIAKMRGYDFNFSKSTGKYNEYIRIADYVASSIRKIKNDDLKDYKYCKIMNKVRLPLPYIKKVFS